MTFSEYLLNHLGMVTVCVVSGILFFMLPLIRRRFSPATGVSTLQATRLINAGSIIVLDVRQPEEFATGHLGRAINIPLDDLAKRIGELDKKSAKNILVYCQRGHRSARAAKVLATTGKAIHNLAGGIVAWKEANLPVETNPAPNTTSGSKKSKKAATEAATSPATPTAPATQPQTEK